MRLYIISVFTFLVQILSGQVTQQPVEGDFVFDKCTIFQFYDFERSALKSIEKEYRNIKLDTISDEEKKKTSGWLQKAIKDGLLGKYFVMIRNGNTLYYLFLSKEDFLKTEKYQGKYDLLVNEGKTIHLKGVAVPAEFLGEKAFITVKPIVIEKTNGKPYSCKYE